MINVQFLSFNSNLHCNPPTLPYPLSSPQVRIDGLAGPSECLVVADDTSNASFVAADLIAQAEHDADASAVLVSLSGLNLSV